ARANSLVYEKRLGSNGYVSVWHDACEETRELALAYDQVFEGLRGDNVLIHFLAGKAKEFKLENPKRSFADVQNNIEGRILRDALANQHKIASNYPRTPIAVAVTKAVLDWPRSRDEVLKLIDAFLKRSTAVDGVTGEKGLANYSAFGLQSIALFLADWDRAIPGFLDDIVRRNPALHSMFRFHIDTWCLNSYYPLSGDTGWFAKRIDQYQGVRFQRFGLESDYSHKDAAISPSMFTFMWRLYELTGDAAFVQALYMANDYSVEGLPHDVFADGHEALQEAVREVIRREGAAPGTTSIDKQRWHLAILRSGTDSHGRAAWLDYDSGGGHSHQDGMNVGLFAYGLDLMPDFGYPPVQFGGWGSAKATWYKQSAAHNTVVIDGANHGNAAGRTTLWAIGESLQCVRASGAAIVAGAKQFERTVATVGCASNDFYMIDVFRVVGGMDHAKFMHSHFGRITTNGLALVPTTSYGAGMQMRRVAVDAAPKPGWWVDWDIEDRYKLLPHEADVHLRYTDLTAEAQAYTAEGWVAAGGYDTNEEAWIPRVITRRTGASAPLASTFVAVVEPYTDSPNIAGVRRLSVAGADGTPYGDTGVAVELDLADGSAHLVLAADVENAVESTPSFPDDRAMVQADWGVRTDAEFCLICRFPDGTPERLVFCNGSFIEFGGVKVVAGASASELAEIAFEDGVPRVVGGAPDQVLRFYRDGTEILVRNAH
ncbi:MAG: hypothetical protein HON70_30440, partial [Lentisphaerae bacterium]|nr:hypothetical protein [Lentisphaerota bacterium]